MSVSRPSESGPASFLGVPIERHPVLGSTNDEAFRRAAEGAPEGLVVACEAQTAGRGRQGRSWEDAPGASLLYSLLLVPRIPIATCPLLGLGMACAVADAGEEAAGVGLTVKWPNDVVHEGRKLCGILAETRAPAPGGRSVLVVGCGVNVNQRPEDFPLELRDRATSLRLAAGGRPLDRGVLFAAILRRFERFLDLTREGDPTPLLEALRPRLPSAGSTVRILQGDGVLEGRVESITEAGALRVRDAASGRVETVAAGAEA